MAGQTTYAFTVLLITTMFLLSYRDRGGHRIRMLWFLLYVIGISSCWLLTLDILRDMGVSDIASSQWRALVFRGSIGTTAVGIVLYNWWQDARYKRQRDDRRHDLGTAGSGVQPVQARSGPRGSGG